MSLGIFEVRNPEIEKLMQLIGRDINGVLPKTHGFALAIFSYGDGGEFFYISSAQREDFVNLLREWIQRIQTH